MSPESLIYMVLVILVVLLVCYVILLGIEHVFGPIDSRIKGIAGLIVLILIILYVLRHVGFLGGRW